eukprot:2397117-Amphidinium_carterae.1
MILNTLLGSLGLGDFVFNLLIKGVSVCKWLHFNTRRISVQEGGLVLLKGYLAQNCSLVKV